jgi:hypothetical protein
MPVIFFNAPENLRPVPFMLEEQERREQLESGYVSETKMKFLPESCPSKVWKSCSKEMREREVS